MQTRYKVLTKDLTSLYLGHQYELGVWYREQRIGEPGRFSCVKGFYAGNMEFVLPDAPFEADERVFECNVRGKQIGTHPFTECWEELCVVRQLEEEEVRTLAQEANVGYDLEEALYPVNPFAVERAGITEEEIALLKEWAKAVGRMYGLVADSIQDSIKISAWRTIRDSVWASVRASVWDSVWASVGDSVWDSVRASVYDSVWASVGYSVRASVWAYLGSLFPKIQQWKGIDHPPGTYPFQAAATLWRAGLVPVYDGETWMLVGAEGIVYTLE